MSIEFGADAASVDNIIVASHIWTNSYRSRKKPHAQSHTIALEISEFFLCRSVSSEFPFRIRRLLKCVCVTRVACIVADISIFFLQSPPIALLSELCVHHTNIYLSIPKILTCCLVSACVFVCADQLPITQTRSRVYKLMCACVETGDVLMRVWCRITNTGTSCLSRVFHCVQLIMKKCDNRSSSICAAFNRMPTHKRVVHMLVDRMLGWST